MTKHTFIRRILSAHLHLLAAGLLVISAAMFNPAIAEQESVKPVIPVQDTVTMVDLGAGTCIPCKMMAPIIEKLKVDYKDRAAILFIDVWKDRSQAKRFGVMSIPTQIFFDRHGKEVYRHTGFFSREEIKKWLDLLIGRKS